nr:MAG TPA: hypothetical protein [Caudoviricetes sp.]
MPNSEQELTKSKLHQLKLISIKISPRRCFKMRLLKLGLKQMV